MRIILSFTFLGFLFLGLNTNAQVFKYGAIGGFDITSNHITNPTIRSDDNRLYNSMTSFNTNGYIGYKSGSFWGISIEPGFMRKGGIDKNETAVINDDIQIRLNYIQMPVLFDIYMTNKIFFSFGPEIAYLLNGNTKTSGIISYNIWDLYSRRFEMSGLIGVNYCLTNHIDIAIRYNHGFTWTSKVIIYELNKTSNEYNQYLQLMIRLKV